MKFFSTIAFVMVVFLGLAQPNATIQLPEKLCKNEIFQTINTSAGASQFLWEFAYGGLQTTPVAANLGVTAAANAPNGITLHYEAGNYIGFVVSTNSNNLIRLDFGNSLNNTPARTDLGTLGGVLSRPRGIAIILYNNNWYGLVANFNPATGAASVVRLDFGSTLSNTPAAVNLGTFSGRLTQPQAIQWVTDKGELIALIGDRSQRKILMVNFGQDPTTTIFVNVFIEVNFPGAGFFRDFSIVRAVDRWYGLVIFENGGIHKINFASTLFATPQVIQITADLPAFTLPYNVHFLRDANRFVGIISEYGGMIKSLDFGKNPATNLPTYQNFGNLGSLNNLQGLKFYKTNTGWIGFTHNVATSWLHRIAFTGATDGTLSISMQHQPSLSYTTSGTKYVSLQATDLKNESRFVIDSILVKMDTQADFSFSLNCTGQNTVFQDESITQGVLSWAWDFNDPASGSNTSNEQHPSHQFTAATNFNVLLTVTDDCGNSDQSTHTVSVNNAATTTLGITAESVICSYQEKVYSFTSNATPVEGVVWNFGNGETVAAEMPTYSYSQDGNFIVTVDAVVNECIKQATQASEVKRGAQVLFAHSNPCEDTPVTFSHQITDTDIVLYQWTFAPGEISTEENPEYTFASAGEYDVTLQVENSLGCETMLTKTIGIYSQPQVNFAAALPPFSCNGTPTMFNDLTPNPVDSNIDSWQWNFGDSGSSQNTSTLKNPQHTYDAAGDYDVSLTVSTNFLCSSTLQLPVTISQAPIADFNFTPPCEDVVIDFTDTSMGTIQSWNWQIGSTFYFIQNPTHTFANPVSTNATLNVTATNNCVGSINKPIIVPAKLVPDFSVSKNCTGQETIFTDITNPAADAITNRDWNFHNVGTGTGTPETFTFPTTGNKNITLTLTTQTGCTHAVTKAVNIIASPQANFTASPEAGAPPLEVQFTNTSTGATSYVWSFNDSQNTTSNQPSPAFTYLELGEYVVSLTASNAQNCSNTFSREITVVLPVMDVALTGLELMEYPDGSIKPAITIFNRGNTPVENLGLLINVSGPVIRENVGTSVLPGTSYRHVLEIDIPNPDQLDYLCIEADLEDISPQDNQACQNIEKTFITLPPYPNPANGELHIDWILNQEGVVNVSLINAMGQTVGDISVNSLEGLTPLTLGTAGMSSGVYWVRLSHKSSSIVYKVFIGE